MKVVRFPSQPTLEQALDVIDHLRKDVVEGRVTGFVIAGLDDADCCTAYASSTKPVTRLRMQGAIAQALHAYVSGDL